MKRLSLGLCLLACAVIVGCGRRFPQVPQVSNPHAIVVEGSPMTQTAFLQKYCVEVPADPTCVAVRKAKSEDDGNRGLPKGW